MEFEERSTNSTNTENPPTNDTVELVTEVDEKNVAYRLRRLCCGVKRVLAIIFILVLVVVVVSVVLYSIFGIGKSSGALNTPCLLNVTCIT